MKITFYIILIFLTFNSCEKTEEEKLNKILTSENIIIQLNTYGGLAGYYERIFSIKKNDYESLLIKNEGTDYQTFVQIDNERKLLKEFIIEAYKSNNPEKEMSNSCIGGVDTEYLLKSGLTSMKFRPNEKCDSIFHLILKGTK